MSNDNFPLVLDLVGWVAAAPRTYAETMDAWHTSCPRLTIWEDAVELGLVRRAVESGVAVVRITPSGLDLLGAHARSSPPGLAAE